MYFYRGGERAKNREEKGGKGGMEGSELNDHTLFMGMRREGDQAYHW